MLAIGIILDLVCWRYRKVANGLFIFECLNLIAVNFVPLNYGNYEPFITSLSLLILVVTIGCHGGVNIVQASLLCFLMLFV